MQKSMHFFKVRAFKYEDSDDGATLPAQRVNLNALLDEIYLRSNLNKDLSTLRRIVKQRDLALAIYYSDGRFYKGRFCIIKDGPLSEGVLEMEDGSGEIGNVYAQDNAKLLFKTVAFTYDSERDLVGLSVNCNSMLEDYLNMLNNEHDYLIDTIGIGIDEIVFGVESLSETDFINSILVETTTSNAKEIEGNSWIAEHLRPFGSFAREALVSLKITPEETAGGDVMTITKQAIGEFWDANKDRITTLEVNPNRKGGFKFGSQNHVKRFDATKEGDVLNASELNDKSIEYLSRTD